MADPAEIDIVADRNVDHFSTWSFLEVDYTGSTFKMQIRAVRDTTGTPLLELTTGSGNFTILYAGTATVAAHISAGRLAEVPDGYASGDSLLLSQIRLGISDFSLQALPFPEERGDDWEGYYDIIRTPTSGSAELIMRGKFIDRAGATIP